METPVRKDVYTITENPNGGKGFWTKIGMASTNRDGSMNIILNALPLNGKLHVRDATEFKAKASEEAPVVDSSTPTEEPKKPAKKTAATAPKTLFGATVPKAEDDSPF